MEGISVVLFVHATHGLIGIGLYYCLEHCMKALLALFGSGV